MIDIMFVARQNGEYCPEEGSINGVVWFGKIDRAYIQSRSLSRVGHIGRVAGIGRVKSLGIDRTRL